MPALEQGEKAAAWVPAGFADLTLPFPFAVEPMVWPRLHTTLRILPSPHLPSLVHFTTRSIPVIKSIVSSKIPPDDSMPPTADNTNVHPQSRLPRGQSGSGISKRTAAKQAMHPLRRASVACVACRDRRIKVGDESYCSLAVTSLIFTSSKV